MIGTVSPAGGNCDESVTRPFTERHQHGPANVPNWRVIHSAVGCLVTLIQIRSLRSNRRMTKARATRSVRRDDEHIHRDDIRGMIR